MTKEKQSTAFFSAIHGFLYIAKSRRNKITTKTLFCKRVIRKTSERYVRQLVTSVLIRDVFRAQSHRARAANGDPLHHVACALFNGRTMFWPRHTSG
jgi:hypothetical protein